LFPLRHAIVYNWAFREAATLTELNKRLLQNHFYTARPRDDILVATSLAKPAAVIFVFIQTKEDGGDLVLIQTFLGRYSYDQITRAIRVFAKIAGIAITR